MESQHDELEFLSLSIRLPERNESKGGTWGTYVVDASPQVAWQRLEELATAVWIVDIGEGHQRNLVAGDEGRKGAVTRCMKMGDHGRMAMRQRGVLSKTKIHDKSQRVKEKGRGVQTTLDGARRKGEQA